MSVPDGPGAQGEPPLRGLLVDWGGVMTSGVFQSFSGICRSEGLEPRKLSKLFSGSPQARALLIGFEEGRVSESEFEEHLGDLLGLQRASGLIGRIFEGVTLDEQMVSAVREAHAQGLATGVISNSWGTGRYPRELFDAIFDAVVISAELGIRKPDPRIYLLGAEMIGREPPECVFVDDLPQNLDSARELGMQVIHHLNADTTIAELERLLDIELGQDPPQPD